MEIRNYSYAIFPAKLTSTLLQLVLSVTTSLPFTSAISSHAIGGSDITQFELFTSPIATSDVASLLSMYMLHADAIHSKYLAAQWRNESSTVVALKKTASPESQ